MFSVKGKIWSLERVVSEEARSPYIRMVVKKKRYDKEFSLCFMIFKESIIEQYQNKYFAEGDSVDVKFYIKSKQFGDRYYTFMYVDKITVLRKAKGKTLNMFERNSIA